MNRYIATFHTHLSALRTSRALAKLGAEAKMAPVPRALSSSCGTCVLYSGEEPHLAAMDADTESVWLAEDGERYTLLKRYD